MFVNKPVFFAFFLLCLEIIKSVIIIEYVGTNKTGPSRVLEAPKVKQEVTPFIGRVDLPGDLEGARMCRTLIKYSLKNTILTYC